ncbi:MAG: tRNA-dihydrouridine synthase [Alphaproteobacteria bacterium]|nr:tRNA-dihydrouridine synthase [Alphaproteobacteria bacterium]
MKEKHSFFVAPLAGITDRPFRAIVRDFSPDVSLVTEMISCHSLVEQHKNCPRNFDNYGHDGNIGAQIFGADVSLMADAARILQDNGAKWVDINMGCPVPKVATRAGAGAYLMRDHKLAGDIMREVVRAVEIPVSVKTRLGWDSEHMDWRELVDIAADAGVKFMALHGRTRAAGYTGDAVHPDVHELPIPIIANGDIKDASDVQAMENLGYAGVMVGRAMLGAPWKLAEIMEQKAPQDIGRIVLRHLDLVLDYYGERGGVPLFRKHAAWYSAGVPGATAFRVAVNQITDAQELKDKISEFWGCVV